MYCCHTGILLSIFTFEIIKNKLYVTHNKLLNCVKEVVVTFASKLLWKQCLFVCIPSLTKENIKLKKGTTFSYFQSALSLLKWDSESKVIRRLKVLSIVLRSIASTNLYWWSATKEIIIASFIWVSKKKKQKQKQIAELVFITGVCQGTKKAPEGLIRSTTVLFFLFHASLFLLFTQELLLFVSQ